MTLSPPIPYYGSKGTLAPHIARLLPAHTHYVEPFAGSLAVLMAKDRSPLETVNDLDLQLVTFYRVLRNRTDELAKVCDLTPYSRHELVNAVVDEDGIDELEIARRVFVRLTQGRAGRLANTGWRFQKRWTRDVWGDVQRFLDRMYPTMARMQGVQIECMPALDLIELYGSEPDTLIYADPPYLNDTRNTSTGGGYRHEMLSEDDHAQLAAALRGCQSAVVLSGYRSPLYDRLYEGWHVEEFPTNTTQGGAKKATCEVLWSNRPLGGRVVQTLW